MGSGSHKKLPFCSVVGFGMSVSSQPFLLDYPISKQSCNITRIAAPILMIFLAVGACSRGAS